MSLVQEKFVKMRKELSDFLIERDSEVDVVLTALIARENPLLVGPPGTAKSLLLDSLMEWMHGKKFTILFNKFTTPEEVFGPISVAGLKEDRYRRVTTGKLPEADAGFGDEIFKASSAILNTLLRILNERVYDNGDGTLVKVPLKIFVAASNEWPQSHDGGKELAALFDRFLFRKTVKPIMTAAGKHRLLWHPPHSGVKFSSTITAAELDRAWSETREMSWSGDGMKALEEIIRELNKEGINPGDRRRCKAVFAAQAFAYLCGADEVAPDHLEILTSVLWDDAVEQPLKCEQIIAKVANPASMRINSTLLEVEQILAGIDIRDLKSAASGAKKLQECEKQLGALHDNPRAKKAREYVRSQIKQIHMSSMESVM